MKKRNVSDDVLKAVKSKTGKQVSQKDIQKLAGTVKPSTLQNEQQLRQLVRQVSGLVNAKLSDAAVDDIVRLIKSSKISTDNLEQMVKMMKGR